MAKTRRTNYDPQNNTQKTKYCAKRTPLKAQDELMSHYVKFVWTAIVFKGVHVLLCYVLCFAYTGVQHVVHITWCVCCLTVKRLTEIQLIPLAHKWMTAQLGYGFKIWLSNTRTQPQFEETKGWSNVVNRKWTNNTMTKRNILVSHSLSFVWSLCSLSFLYLRLLIRVPQSLVS
jgi:hypothetical protein